MNNVALVRQFYAPRDGVSNDIIGSSLRGRGEVSAGDDLDRQHLQHLGRLESWQSVECIQPVESIQLEEGVCSSGIAR